MIKILNKKKTELSKYFQTVAEPSEKYQNVSIYIVVIQNNFRTTFGKFGSILVQIAQHAEKDFDCILKCTEAEVTKMLTK